MSTILIPTDFSLTARNAVAYAIKMAMQLNADIVIFHANDPEKGRIDEDVLKDFDFLRKDIETGFKGAVKINYELEHGKLKDILSRTAKQYKADIVLMGTNGKSADSGHKIGSNAYMAVENCSLPVLVVPPRAVFNGISNLILALNFNMDFEQVPLLPLLKTLQLLGGQLFVLSVIHSEAGNPAKAVMDVQKIEVALKNTPHSFHYVYNDNIDTAIADFCDMHYADILVMLPQKHSWLKKLFNTSHTENMVYHIKTPVLAIR